MLARMAKFRRPERVPAWRKLALVTWGQPSGPAAYGVLDLDCERALDWAARAREASGEKVTLTHVCGKAAAIAIASAPETNGFASMGGLKLRETVDVFFQVAFFDEESRAAAGGERETRRDANLAGAKIERVDEKNVVEIARELREKAEAIRSKKKDATVKAAKLMSGIPGPLRAVLARLMAFLSFDLGWNLSAIGIPHDTFGSCMITNVGTFGIEMAWAPLIPYARTPICITLGAIRRAPTVVGDTIVPRKRVSIGVVFDHRVLDGYQAGVMARRFEEIFADPDTALGNPAQWVSPTKSANAPQSTSSGDAPP
jgi:pyruvate/2-oxoglutarate dehydrogenase complex dihydrolipoamide acyltransferase (E2) component